MKLHVVILALFALAASSPARDADPVPPTLAEACLMEIPADHPEGCIEASMAASRLLPILEVFAMADDTTGIVTVYDSVARFVMETEQEPRLFMSPVLASCANVNAFIERTDVAYGQLLEARRLLMALHDEYVAMLDKMAADELDTSPEMLCRVQSGAMTCMTTASICVDVSSRMLEGNDDEDQVRVLTELHASVEPLVGQYAGMVKGIEEAFENLDHQYGEGKR